jgi:hypothetical protein
VIIDRIEATGLFSFGTDGDRLVLDLDEGLNVIVGPNAAGKTNVLRLIELVRTAVLYQDLKRQDRNVARDLLDEHVRSARYDEMDLFSPSEARLSLRLTTGDEKLLVMFFIQAVVIAALLDNKVADAATLRDLEDWVATEVTYEDLKSLYRGTIVVSHSGVPGTQWRVAYEFEHAGDPFIWHLQTPLANRAHVIERRTSTPTGVPNHSRLVQRLHGEVKPSSSPHAPSTSFQFEALLPEGNEVIDVVAGVISVVDCLPAPLRTFAELAGPWLPTDYLTPQQPTLSLAGVFSVVFAAALRYPIAASTGPSMSSAASTDDPVTLLSDRLFRLKNGEHGARSVYSQIQKTFSELAPSWGFEVRAEERRQADQRTLAKEIEVFPDDGHSLPVRPLRLAGKGIEQALLLADALTIVAGHVLLLDEPATKLHPSWQRIVRSHLVAARGQRLLVTHTPYLVPAEDGLQLGTVVRLSAPTGKTQVHRLPASGEDPDWTDVITKELTWSADARGLLFANGAVLLEGETELGALPVWFAKSPAAARHGRPEDLQVAFYCVGGDQSFGALVRYLDRFGVPWAIVCDGAAFRFDKRTHIFD